MPSYIRKPSPVDVAGLASRLPRPVQKPVAMLGSLAKDFLGGDEISMPVPAMTAIGPLAGRWAAGARPKVGGVLHEVLERAGAKAGGAQPVSPGERDLLQHFGQQLRVGPRQTSLPPPPSSSALGVTNEFQPWVGLAKIRGLMGF